MAYPKKKPCPKCGEAGSELSVYTYENGARHVECDNCYYLGPAACNILSAIRLHNDLSAQNPVS